MRTCSRPYREGLPRHERPRQSFATRGPCADVIRLVLESHELITGEFVLDETRRVLREKFGLPEQTISDVEALLRRRHVEPVPEQPPVLEVRDPDDRWVLASALAAGAEMLVTGDKNLLVVNDEVDALDILTPRAFWERARTPPG